MRDAFQTLVLGLIAGGIYGLMAVAIVLVYRGSRVLNFALGEIGTFALFITSVGIRDWHLPYVVAAALAVVAAVAVSLVFEAAVVRRMVDATRLSVAIATIGLLFFLLSLEVQLFGVSPRSVPGPLSSSVDLAGIVITGTQVLALLVAAGIGVSLTVLLRRTDFGLGVIAAADDPTTVRLVGVRVSRVSAFTWGVGGAIAAVAALLIEPTVGAFAPGYGSRLYLFALVAAIVGGLSSLNGAFVGGLVVGLLEATVQKVVIRTETTITGLEVLAVFVLLLTILLVRPQGLLGKAAS